MRAASWRAGRWLTLVIVAGLIGPRDAEFEEREPPRTELLHPCSRPASRRVQKRLGEEVPKLSKEAGQSELPERCPFHPKRDLYFTHEKKKLKKTSDTGRIAWTCGICGRAFKKEHYLDLHMERTHWNSTTDKGVCLADFCEIFDSCSDGPPPRSEKAACQPEAMWRARRRCEVALAECFPLDEGPSRAVHAKLSRQWCQVLDCETWLDKVIDAEAHSIPVILLMIVVALVGFVVFSCVVCCVDYSDDIGEWAAESFWHERPQPGAPSSPNRRPQAHVPSSPHTPSRRQQVTSAHSRFKDI